jgi:hypothetical protein
VLKLKKGFLKFFLLTSFLGFKVHAIVDLDQLKSALEGAGLVGEVHGIHLPNSLHAFTYRNPSDFFDYITLPLVAENSVVGSQLDTIKRHEVVRVFGTFVDNKAPIKHILVKKIEVVKTHNSETDQFKFVPKTPLSEVTAQSVLTGRVHAISPEGSFFLMEYKDLILPVFVRSADQIEQARHLYRGDLLRLSYRVRNDPKQPVHLTPLPGSSSIQVLERIQSCHGQNLEKEGFLVKFPKSPQILNDTFAILVEDSVGTTVQFTLINFEQVDLNAELRKVLQAAWNQAPNTLIENGRNKLIHRGILIKARGQCNVVSQAQANPQILFSSLADISVKLSP